MKTLEEFRATGRDCADLGEAVGQPELWEGYKARGRLYDAGFWIEHLPDEWPLKPEVAGQWWVALDNGDYLGELSELEVKLYEWAAGYLGD
jgi:hypothetical protein